MAAIERAPAEDAGLIVIGGEGRHFCTGFDLTGIDRASDGDLLLRFVRIERLLQPRLRIAGAGDGAGQGHG